MTGLLHAIALALFPTLVITAALKDLTSYTIPNWISAALVVSFPLAVVAYGATPMEIGASALVGVAALFAGAAMFALGWIGGGDAKMFAACGLWLGWPAVLPFLMGTALAGGGLAVALLWSRKLSFGYVQWAPAWFGRLMTPGADVPYGLAICLGALIAFPQGPLHLGAPF